MDYVSSFDLAEFFGVQTFTPTNVRAQVLERCDRARVSVGKDDRFTMYTFTGDIEALIHTIEDHQRREAYRDVCALRPAIGKLDLVIKALDALMMAS